MDTISECCICREQYDKHSTIVIIKHSNDSTLDISRKRGHYFHKSCIEQWKVSSLVCPLDRDPINKLYTVPGYQIVGLELGSYEYDYRKLITGLKINDKLLEQITTDDVDKNNRTLAFYACKMGNYTLVNKLLKHGANFNKGCGDSGFTPLMVAVCYNHHQIVSRLLSNKRVQEDINAYDNKGNTAFSYACKNRHCTIMGEFLNRGLVTKHQVRYCLDMYRNTYKKDNLYGEEIISRLCHYLKSD